MSKIKILLVGDGNHQLITNYSKWLTKSKLSQNFEIDILSLTKTGSSNLKFYSKVYEVQFNFIHKIKLIRKYFKFYQYKKLISALPNYDYVHFHFIGRESQYILKQISKNTNSKIITSIWGSDMFRNKSKRFISTCEISDILTFTSKDSIDFFKSKYNWTKENINLCPFGLAPLEYLKKLTKTKTECKVDLKLNPEKIVITVGYNMAPQQQHLEILDQFLDKNLLKLKDKVQIVLPITYGGSINYKQNLLRKLNKLPFEYKVFDSYLSDNDVAKIRKASDIMLQFQITDQLSGSMLEHLFVKNIIITGSWLPYKSLKENNCWFYDVKKIKEIKLLIPQIISNYELISKKTDNNPKLISSLYSWNITIKDWINLYKI